jgi:hypothetical protein
MSGPAVAVHAIARQSLGVVTHRDTVWAGRGFDDALYVGRTWAGAQDTPYGVLPYFFSDIGYWTSLEYLGRGSGDAWIDGSMNDNDFAAYYTDDAGRLTACLTVSRSEELNEARDRIVRRFERGRIAPQVSIRLESQLEGKGPKMTVTPRCPYCNSVEQPSSITQEYDVTRLLVLYCGSCGAILAAADYNPSYSGSGVHPSTRQRDDQ